MNTQLNDYTVYVCIWFNACINEDIERDLDDRKGWRCRYKGTMKDGTEVAIKVLRIPNEGGFEEEAM